MNEDEIPTIGNAGRQPSPGLTTSQTLKVLGFLLVTLPTAIAVNIVLYQLAGFLARH